MRWRRERDSNPRSGDRKAVFKTAAFNHSAIPPAEVLFYTPQANAASVAIHSGYKFFQFSMALKTRKNEPCVWCRHMGLKLNMRM